jgi:hypothetical protein
MIGKAARRSAEWLNGSGDGGLIVAVVFRQ